MANIGGVTLNSGSSENPMMIVALVKHFNIRLGEWLSSFILLSLGVLFFTAQSMFDRTPMYFAGLLEFSPQVVWACIFATFGTIRICALYVNGRRPITPYIRMVLAFLSCFVWWQLAISLFVSGVPGLAWAIVPWLLALDMYNVFRSSADAREVFDKKRASRNNGIKRPS